jgi:hypothetical protein
MAPTIAFTVGDIGDPIECDLVGRTFAIELGSARFVEPEGVAELLLGEFEDDILIGVAAEGGGELNMLGAISEGAGGPQNYCNPSIDFPVASFGEDPYFAVGPTDINIDVAGVNIQISSLEITGSFRSDCSSFEGGTLAGELDARVLGPLLLDAIGTGDPDEICSLLLGFGVSCEACSSDGAMYCVEVYVDQMTAGEADMTLECIDETNCHELCGSNECADPALGECD